MRAGEWQPGPETRVIESEGSDPDTWIVEFRDRRIDEHGTVLAVIRPEEGSWQDSVVSVPAEVAELPVAFVRWALDTAQQRLGG
ncbi:hypothetical protein [Kitasatospora purpeofusca]|uniref:hypothetical protein n=1 Tax=Kitasatospora purpeofusca TaxID=67352 RepID=UPI00224E1F5D|nr:hypothetical protein [Kitasatospora purpeofusca]MCX4683899.1 hypothetical protein [Kitasatospora purpeofusca]